MGKKRLTLIYTYGLPASGKTTWAKAWVEEDPKERVRVNRDDIRKMLGPYWVPQREQLVTDIEQSTIIDALDSGYSVVVDSTNFLFDYSDIIDVIGRVEFGETVWEALTYMNNTNPEKELNIEIVKKDFTNVSVEECIKRDLLRKDTDGYVGADVIRRMAKKYLNYDK